MNSWMLIQEASIVIEKKIGFKHLKTQQNYLSFHQTAK